jgi:site-specific DNA-methyltransferase (cytosine-N4-specific)
MKPDAVIDHEGDGAVIIRHDARSLPLEDESVDLIVTSPPYFALRSYRDDGEHYDGQLGSEDSPQEFVDNLVDCVRRS